MRVSTAIAAVACIAFGCASQEARPVLEQAPLIPEVHFERHYTESFFQVTEKAFFSVELLPAAGKLGVGNNSLDIIVHECNTGNVEGASITVEPFMAGHGHGVTRKPQIAEKGSGHYRIENIRFNMEGDWDLKISISKGGKSDKTVFHFPDIELAAGNGARNMGSDVPSVPSLEERPAGLDLSCRKQSTRGLFEVSYKSRFGSVSLYRKQTWELLVRNGEGKAARGLEVKVDASMPGDGHKMEISPWVDREVGAGVYILEGMKFNMPGHWEVSVYLKKGQETDSVSFDLLLSQ